MHDVKSASPWKPMAVRKSPVRVIKHVATLVLILTATVFTYNQLMSAVSHGIQHSQFASSEDGPVKYRWTEKDGTKKCSVIEHGKSPVGCEYFSKEKLEQIVLLWEKPKVVQLKFACEYC